MVSTRLAALREKQRGVAERYSEAFVSMCLFVRYNKDRERCFKDENVKSYVLRIIYIIFVMSIPIVFSAGIALMKSPGQWRGKRPEVVIIISSIQMLFGIVLTVFALYAIRFLN